jgi:hypothetical protein
MSFVDPYHHFVQVFLFLIICFSPVFVSLAFTMIETNVHVRDSRAYFILSVLIIWTGIQTFVSLLLGMIGHFNIWSILWVELIVLIVGLGVSKSLVRQYLTNFSILRFSNQLTVTPTLNLLFYISCLGIILFFNLATQPIIDTDSLWYHLPFMARWYQDFAFTKLPEFSRFTSSDWIAEQIGYYPFSWEALCTVFILPFKEDFLVTLPNLISWGILGLSTFLLGLEFGASSFCSLASSVLLLVVPINLQQINTLHVDLPLAAFFISATFFAIIYQKTYSISSLLLSLVSISILLGIKTSGIAYAALVILLLILSFVQLFLREAREFRHVNITKRKALFISTILLPIFFVASFWYLKNFIEIGNPLGNVSVKLFGLSVLPGSLDSSKIRGTTLASLFHPFNLDSWKVILVQILGRLQFPFFIFIVLNFILVFYLRQVVVKFNSKLSLTLLILLIGSGFLYWNTPYNAAIGNSPWTLTPQVFGQALRYGLPFLAILSITASVTLTLFNVNKNYVVRVIWLCCILGLANHLIYDIVRTQGTFKANVGGGSILINTFIKNFNQNPFGAVLNLINTIKDILINPALFMGLYCMTTLFSKPLILGIFKISRNIFHLRTTLTQVYKVFASIIMIVFALSIITYGIRENRTYERNSIYGDAFKYISEQLKPAEKVGYVLSTRSYLLYGKNLDKKVIYTGTNSDRLTEYEENLHIQDISFLAVGPFIDGNFSSDKEAGWIVDNSRLFTPLFDLDPNFSQALYRVVDSPVCVKSSRKVEKSKECNKAVQ